MTDSLLPDNQDGEPAMSDYAKRHIHSCVGCPAPGAHFCSCGASKSDRQSGWSPAPASFQAGKPAWELYPDVAKRPATTAPSSPSSLGSPPELRALIADVRDALNVTVDAKGLASLAAIEQYASRLVEQMERLSGQAVGWHNIAKLTNPPSGSPPELKKLLDEFKRCEEWLATEAEKGNLPAARLWREKADTVCSAIESLFASQLTPEEASKALNAVWSYDPAIGHPDYDSLREKLGQLRLRRISQSRVPKK